MNVITVASRKGGAGKTTLTAHLAGYAHALGHRCCVIDADPQGSLGLCNALREEQALPLMTAERGIERPLALAAVENYDYVFIDTAPTLWVMVQAAIRAATLVVVPARPGFMDLAAVRETVKTASDFNKPYAVVLNACPVKRGAKEAPTVAQSRAYLEHYGIPVWSGQVSQRAGFVLSLAGGASAGESGADAQAADEIARLWTAVERSVEVINSAHADVSGMAGRAA